VVLIAAVQPAGTSLELSSSDDNFTWEIVAAELPSTGTRRVAATITPMDASARLTPTPQVPSGVRPQEPTVPIAG
jgi:hypothetical protein